MKLKRLNVVGLRGITEAEFEFDPNFTLLVGVNGVGKSTILDALRVCLSRTLPKFTASRARPLSFESQDISIVQDALTVELTYVQAGQDFEYLLHEPRVGSVPLYDGVVREQVLDTPSQERLTPELSGEWRKQQKSETQPVAIYFSTRRTLVSDEQPTIGKSAGGQAAAFAGALSPRSLLLSDIASWMVAQRALAKEDSKFAHHLDALQAAANSFMPEFNSLQPVGGKRPTLTIKKGGLRLDVRQLSDGERSMFALVLDIARRLAQANPGLVNPVRDGVGLVLIDEIDLHLHPKWQRRVVQDLVRTFPNCQFIATTHSPQVIGEVPHENIRMIENGKTYSPLRSYGVDSSRVLEEVMGVSARNHDVEIEIGRIAKLISDQKRNEAKAAIEALANQIGDDDPEVTRARMLLDFMEAGE